MPKKVPRSLRRVRIYCLRNSGAESNVNRVFETYNWMIGCDVSGSFESRVTEWRYREVSEDESAESESCVLVSFTLAAILAYC